ncbi:MAG: class I SAM-dependent methyltransferase [Chloroflexota bacterium]
MNEEEGRNIRRVFVARDQRHPRAWMTRGYAVLTAERRALTTEILESEFAAGERPSILDVGCGSGLDLEWWREQGWPAERLAGIDLVDERVAAAQIRNPGVDVRRGEGAMLPFADAAFDVATASTVFSSISNATSRRALFAEMGRVVRTGGLIIVYDFVLRNPRNSDVVPMTAGRIADLARRTPDRTWRVSPLIYAVGPASLIHPRLGRLVGRVMPRTHRLSLWRA